MSRSRQFWEKLAEGPAPAREGSRMHNQQSNRFYTRPPLSDFSAPVYELSSGDRDESHPESAGEEDEDSFLGEIHAARPAPWAFVSN